MDHRLFIPLLIATLVAFPVRSRADDTQWESLEITAAALARAAAKRAVLRPEDLRKIALASR